MGSAPPWRRHCRASTMTRSCCIKTTFETRRLVYSFWLGNCFSQHCSCAATHSWSRSRRTQGTRCACLWREASSLRRRGKATFAKEVQVALIFVSFAILLFRSFFSVSNSSFVSSSEVAQDRRDLMVIIFLNNGDTRFLDSIAFSGDKSTKGWQIRWQSR